MYLKITKTRFIKISQLVLLAFLIILTVKYVFITPEPGNTNLAIFRNSVHFIWWIILFEVLITGIIYKTVPVERIKEYLPVFLFSCILLTLALHNGVLDLQGSPTGDHRMMYMAESQKILVGNWPWEDPQYQGELTTYSYLYFTIVAIISMISSISPGKLYILLGVVNRVLLPFVMYWAGKKLFNKEVGLLAAFFSLFYFYYYWGGPHWPGVMLQVFALVWFYEGKYLKSGLTLGLIVWTYYPYAPVVIIAMAMYRLFVFLSTDDETVRDNFRILAKTILIGGLTSAPFTLPLFLKYHFVVMNTARMAVSVQDWRHSIFFGMNLDYTGLFYKIFILGLVITFVRRKKNDLLVLSWFITTYIVAHHIIATFFDFHVIQMLRTRSLEPGIVLLLSIAVYGVLKFLYPFFKNVADNEIKRDVFIKIGIVTVILMWGPSSINANLSPPQIWSHWEEPDRPDSMEQLNWIKDNTEPDDIIFSGWNYAQDWVVPFTGRKVVFAGKHTNLFLDPAVRGSDYNLMWVLDFDQSRDLFIKYNVKYVINRRPLKYTSSGELQTLPDKNRRDLLKNKEFKLIKRFKAGDIYEFVPVIETD